MVISCGYYHTCAMGIDFKITCWGNDDYKQVSDTPTSDKFSFISSGNHHNCAIYKENFKITCWGSDYFKEVSDTPTSDEFSFISSGAYHNCAIYAENSKIICWGYDNYDQVRDPNVAHFSTMPIPDHYCLTGNYTMFFVFIF